MKKVITAIFLGAMIWACGNSEPTGWSTEAAPTVAPDGKKIFRKNCVVCHGARGNMGGNGAYDLTKSELSKAERVHVITNGRNTMSAFSSTLSPEEIEAVAEYSLTLKSKE